MDHFQLSITKSEHFAAVEHEAPAFLYLFVDVDVRLVRGPPCGVPAQELHVFEDLFN